jgi:hypothetical protein
MIPKPGKDPTNPLSYRPISLLNIAGKVFEKILSTHLKNFLEINRSSSDSGLNAPPSTPSLSFTRTPPDMPV